MISSVIWVFESLAAITRKCNMQHFLRCWRIKSYLFFSNLEHPFIVKNSSKMNHQVSTFYNEWIISDLKEAASQVWEAKSFPQCVRIV